MNAVDRHPEIVFDLEHETPVIDALRSLRYQPGHIERSRDLRLGLVALERAPDAGDPFAVLDIVLMSVRGLCRARHAGWEPVVGKNRALDPLHPASWHIGPGGDSDPVPMRPLSWHIGPGGVAAGPVSSPTEAPWELPAGDAGYGVKVGLLDTAVYTAALRGASLEWVDRGNAEITHASDSALAVEGHATFVAGCVLSRAPRAVIVVDAVFGKHQAAASSWDVAQKMASFAYQHQVDILNLSLGCVTDDGRAPLVLSRAVQVLTPSTQIVAATGNEPSDDNPVDRSYRKGQPVWPAASPEVISVAASTGDDSDRLADFSAHDIPWASLVAPGVNVQSAYLAGTVRVSTRQDRQHIVEFNGSASWSGTSFAAGRVTGALAANFYGSESLNQRRATVQQMRSGGGRELKTRDNGIRPYPKRHDDER